MLDNGMSTDTTPGTAVALQNSDCDEGQRKTRTPCSLNQLDFSNRVEVKGKFLFLGEEKFWVKGVSYGAFQPDEEGQEYTNQENLHRDFKLMAKHGINVVRIPHTMPPRHLLDIAQEYGLRVMERIDRASGSVIDSCLSGADNTSGSSALRRFTSTLRDAILSCGFPDCSSAVGSSSSTLSNRDK